MLNQNQFVRLVGLIFLSWIWVGEFHFTRSPYIKVNIFRVVWVRFLNVMFNKRVLNNTSSSKKTREVTAPLHSAQQVCSVLTGTCANIIGVTDQVLIFPFCMVFILTKNQFTVSTYKIKIVWLNWAILD